MSAVGHSRPPVARVAITAPPRDWFHGIAHSIFAIYRRALVDLGVAVFDVPVDTIRSLDAGRYADLLDDLRAFRPELAFGLPLGSHALICRMTAERDGFRPNLFTDVLDIPTICFWDHAPFEPADQLLTPHPATPQRSTGGALARLQRALAHPRLIHWSRDSGQTALMKEFGLLSDTPIVYEASPSFGNAAPGPSQPPPAGGDATDVGFVGHFYQNPPNRAHPALAALAEDAIRLSIERGGAPWDALAGRIASLPAGLRTELALDRDQTFFWGFAHRLIVHEAQTALRLRLLGDSRTPIACYGNLRNDLPGVPHNLMPVPGHIPFGPKLFAILTRHRITVDVQNPGFIHGFSHKVMQIFANGGFALVDRKRDFVAAFGDAGEAVSYGSGEELGAKIDRFLSRPGLRREAGDAIRERIAARHGLNDVLRRVLEQAAATTTSPRRPPNPVPISAPAKPIDLMPMLRRCDFWSGARLLRSAGEIAISTSRRQWTCAAAVTIPRAAMSMREPHLRVALVVESGCIDIRLRAAEEASAYDARLVGPSRRPVAVDLELPNDRRVTVILRNAAAGEPSRAKVLGLELRDRPAAHLLPSGVER